MGYQTPWDRGLGSNIYTRPAMMAGVYFLSIYKRNLLLNGIFVVCCFFPLYLWGGWLVSGGRLSCPSQIHSLATYSPCAECKSNNICGPCQTVLLTIFQPKFPMRTGGQSLLFFLQWRYFPQMRLLVPEFQAMQEFWGSWGRGDTIETVEDAFTIQ